MPQMEIRLRLEGMREDFVRPIAHEHLRHAQAVMLRDSYQFPVIGKWALTIRQRPCSEQIEGLPLVTKQIRQILAIALEEFQASPQRPKQFVIGVGDSSIEGPEPGTEFCLHECYVIGKRINHCFFHKVTSIFSGWES